MSDKKEKEEGEEKKGGGKKKLIIIIIVAVLVLGGAGAFFALGGSKKPADGEDGEEEEAPAEAEHGAEKGHGGGGHGEGHGGAAGGIVPLETFIVNLSVKGSFLKTTVQLEFGEGQPPATMEADMPKIRDSILRILSSKISSDILTVDGKDKLREEIKEAVNQVLDSEDVSGVYFTEFIVQ